VHNSTVDWYFRRRRILLERARVQGWLRDEGRLEIRFFEDWKSERKSLTTSANHEV
jgi:hypothetical protein